MELSETTGWESQERCSGYIWVDQASSILLGCVFFSVTIFLRWLFFSRYSQIESEWPCKFSIKGRARSLKILLKVLCAKAPGWSTYIHRFEQFEDLHAMWSLWSLESLGDSPDPLLNQECSLQDPTELQELSLDLMSQKRATLADCIETCWEPQSPVSLGQLWGNRSCGISWPSGAIFLLESSSESDIDHCIPLHSFDSFAFFWH